MSRPPTIKDWLASRPRDSHCRTCRLPQYRAAIAEGAAMIASGDLTYRLLHRYLKEQGYPYGEDALRRHILNCFPVQSISPKETSSETQGHGPPEVARSPDGRSRPRQSARRRPK